MDEKKGCIHLEQFEGAMHCSWGSRPLRCFRLQLDIASPHQL